MTPSSPLLLPEQILLLALRDREGTLESGMWHSYALGGAVLAELLLAERIEAEPTRRALIDVLDPSPLDDPALDDCLARVVESKRRASAQTWVSRFANRRELRHQIATGLCKKGILQQDEASILLVFKRKVYPEIDPRPENELIDRLREAIFTDSAEVDPETAILVSIANSAELLKIHFERKDLKRRKARLEQLASGESVSKATRAAVQAAQAAVVAACVVPVIVVSS